MAVLLVVCGLLVLSSMIVRRSGPEPEVRFCQAYAVVTSRWVELDGRRFTIGLAGEEDDLARGCNHFALPVIQPNCGAWQDDANGTPQRTGKVGPFYDDGTCDGSGGGMRLADAPVQIVDEEPHPPGPR